MSPVENVYHHKRRNLFLVVRCLHGDIGTGIVPDNGSSLCYVERWPNPARSFPVWSCSPKPEGNQRILVLELRNNTELE